MNNCFQSEVGLLGLGTAMAVSWLCSHIQFSCPLCNKHSGVERQEAHVNYLNAIRCAMYSSPTIVMTTSELLASSFFAEDDYTKRDTHWASQNHGY